MLELKSLREKVLGTVREQIGDYIKGEHERHCANCGREFTGKSRYNFLCSDGCRSEWNRGWFHPKPIGVRTVVRRRKVA